MTDTITAASLRAHADWFDTTFEPGSVEARSLRNCAARLEVESARDEEAERLARVFWVAAYPTDSQVEVETFATSGTTLVGFRAVLDRLEADGRLLPESGTDLLPCDRCNGSGSEPAAPVPDATPDGTPEKPWPNLRAVPVPVREVRDANGMRWERRNDTEWKGCDGGSYLCMAGHPELAPLVRVDGDKA